MTTMIAGQIVGPRHLEIVEVPIPKIADGEVLVRLDVGSICGSDLPFFQLDTSHPHPALFGVSAPLPPRMSLHELVGFVAQSRNTGFREGDRVLGLPTVPHSGLAEYFVSSNDRAVILPDGPANRLVLSQPLGTVVHACLKLPDVIGQTVVVLGQGPIGLLFDALLRHLGAERVIAVDLLPDRLNVSRTMGATHVVSANTENVTAVVQAITDGKLADVVVEAIGKEETLNLGAGLLRRTGTLLGFGLPHQFNYEFPFHEFFWNEGRLICSLGPTLDDFHTAVEMISNGVIDVTPLLTHNFPLSRAQEAFTLFADRADGVIKVALTSAAN